MGNQKRTYGSDKFVTYEVDVDFDPIGRIKVIDYLKGKYGIEHVLQVSNHTELKAKAALKDVARYYNYSFDQAQKISDLIPVKMEVDGEDVTTTISEAMKLPAMQPFVAHDPELFEIAKELEGSYRGAGKHAGAVIITQKPVTEILPVMRSPGSDDGTFNLQTQWDKKQLEKLGINKYDLLGLSTLGTLNRLENITGIRCVDIPMDDPQTWKFLKSARNMEGVFQLSSDAMKGWCRKIVPNYTNGAKNLVDYLSDINAINRPAVLDAGLGKQYVDNVTSGSYNLKYDYPFIRNVLDSTHGVVLYQEQVMHLAEVIAGFDLGKGDMLRRNLENMGTAGKKTAKVIKENEQFKKEFVDAAKRLHLLSDSIAIGLWNWLCDSSGYGFNRSHSWTYSLIGYRTAFFKSNFPLDFYCVAINEALEKSDAKDNPVEKIVGEAQSVGIKIKLPTNKCKYAICTVENGEIVYGLNMIKGLTEKACNLFIDMEFNSFDDFCHFVLGTKTLNKKHVKILIQLGYFDEFLPSSKNYDFLWTNYQQLCYTKDNEAKLKDWENNKAAGKKVREFQQLKVYEYELLSGHKKEWLLDLIGFEFENKLFETLQKIPQDLLDNPEYIVGSVASSKSGVSKFGKPWTLVTINTQDGDKKGFLADGNQRVNKNDVLVCKYKQKDDTYTFQVVQRL